MSFDPQRDDHIAITRKYPQKDFGWHCGPNATDYPLIVIEAVRSGNRTEHGETSQANEAIARSDHRQGEGSDRRKRRTTQPHYAVRLGYLQRLAERMI
jgi:hypothetical protein